MNITITLLTEKGLLSMKEINFRKMTVCVIIFQMKRATKQEIEN